LAFGREPRHTPVTMIFTEKDLLQDAAYLRRQHLLMQIFQLNKSKEECLLGEVY